MTDHFHLFPDLAPELRVKIWKFHLHIPRRIWLLDTWCRNCGHLKVLGGKPPILLSVNSESRHESLHYYQRVLKHNPCSACRGSFGAQYCKQNANHDFGGYPDTKKFDGIYINPFLDTVYMFQSMTTSRINRFVDDLDTSSIQHLELRDEFNISTISSVHRLVYVLSAFTHLKSLKSLTILGESTKSRHFAILKDMNRFKREFESSINDGEIWAFPKLIVRSAKIGKVLAVRQACLDDKQEDGYEWEVVGRRTVHKQVDTMPYDDSWEW